MKRKFKKLPMLKKDIQDFLLSEEGKITKKDIAKMGMALAIFSMMFKPTQTFAQHSSEISNPGLRGRHTSHSSHASHASHASHCNGVHISSW